MSKKVDQLIQEVFGFYGEKDRKMAEEDPETCLIALLETLKTELPRGSGATNLSIERAVINASEEKRLQLAK